MNAPLLVHITAGGVGIITGYVALFAAKGARVHRRSGMLFVFSMVTMAVSGAVMAAFRGESGNMVAGMLTAYLVVTGMSTVRDPSAGTRRLDVGAMLVGLTVGVGGLALGIDSASRGEAVRDGSPVPMLILFGAIALASSLSDLRVMRAGGVRGPARMRRHLWRMCVSLFIAAGSFFMGQADELPEALRVFPLLAIPSFLPLVVIPYWLWRVRGRRKPRAPRAAGAASSPEGALAGAG